MGYLDAALGGSLGPSVPQEPRKTPAPSPPPRSAPAEAHRGYLDAALGGAATAAHAVTNPIDTGLRKAAYAVTEAVGRAAEPVEKVLGAPQRAIAGAVTAAHEGHPERALGAAWDSVRTGDERYQKGEREALGVDRFVDADPSAPWYRKAANIGLKTGVQWATDPLMYTPVGWIGKAERAVVGGARAATKAIPLAEKAGRAVSESAPVRGVREALDLTHGMSAEIGGTGAREMLALENEARAKAAEVLTDEKLAKNGVVLPEEQKKAREQFAQRYLQTEAEKRFGFDTAHYAKKAQATSPTPPGGGRIAPRSGKPTSFPLGASGATMPARKAADLAGATPRAKPHITSHGEVIAPKPITPDLAGAKAELEAKAAQQRQRLDQYLTQHGRASLPPGGRELAARNAPTELRTALRGDPDYQHLLTNIDAVLTPGAVHKWLYQREEFDRLMAQAPEFLKTIGKGGRFVSNALKDMLFLNPVPHMKNVVTLLYESPGGAPLVGEAMRLYARSRSPEFAAASKHLDDIGAASGFFHERENLFAKLAAKLGPIAGAPAAGANKWAEWSHDALWQFDRAARIALYNRLTRKFPAMTEGEKAAYINQQLIDYAHRSPLADSLSFFGAPFANWRVQNPQRQVRAFFENPAAVSRIAGAEENVNKQLKDQGYQIDFASPLDEGAKALNLATTLPYAMTTMGSEWQDAARLATRKEDVQDIAAQGVGGYLSHLAERLGPFGSTTMEAFQNPYNVKAPGAVRAGLTVMGSYATNPPGAYREWVRYYKSLGLDDFQAQRWAERMSARNKPRF